MKWSVDRKDRDAPLQELSCHAKDELISLVSTSTVSQEYHGRPLLESRTPEHGGNTMARLGDFQGFSIFAHQPDALSVHAH
jgi:hypothetical protein